MNLKVLFCGYALILFVGCVSPEKTVPTVGFVDAFEDQTIAQARTGFTDALKAQGYSEEEQTVEIIHRNAQGDIATLNQIVNYFVAEKVDLIASNTTLSTITSIQRTKEIPIFMMVSPEPQRMEVVGTNGHVPPNLFGVSESLAYIDTSFSLIPTYVKPKKENLIVGMIYNQAEPQSVDALKQVQAIANRMGIVVEALPLNNSSEAQLITKSLLNRGIDVFFANPDNTVFAAFETILKNCNEQGVPIFTSEAGLVKRGAVAAFGADIYQWGYQAGEQAAVLLKTGETDNLRIELVKHRKRVYNPKVAARYGLSFPDNFEEIE